ncbi:helix-turn-helix transcriptional regulator [Wenzhouxiangella sediminis]|uniref:Transcriptional regulator n=1 Tax=Wenzhouxiangella sediminis TaxID=1792836 RepID=A0A3E1K778_9GAMM|nr:transcriptional regulator [Wenzhouxiangella sediminis]
MGAAINNRVRELRQAGDGMTQQDLAAAVGVSRQTIIAIERGRYSPSLEVALKIAWTFGQPVETVFRLSDEPE